MSEHDLPAAIACTKIMVAIAGRLIGAGLVDGELLTARLLEIADEAEQSGSDEEVESARLVRLFAQHIQEKRAPALRVIHGGAAAG
jgi:hypothetical protein